jgi:hypothetical protein
MPNYDPVAEAEANLAIARLERRLVELKDDDPDGELGDVKLELREARKVYREMRETVPAEGDAVAAPETVTAKASTQKAGD